MQTRNLLHEQLKIDGWLSGQNMDHPINNNNNNTLKHDCIFKLYSS